MSERGKLRHLTMAAVAGATLATATALAPEAGASAPARPSTVAAGKAAAGPGPFYWIISVKKNQPMMPYNHSKERRAPIVTTIKGNYGAQHWKVTGSFTSRKLENRHSHYCVRAGNPGQLVEQDDCGFSGTLWFASSYADLFAGKPVRFENHYTKECLQAYGAIVKTAPCTWNTDQLWRLEHVPGT